MLSQHLVGSRSQSGFGSHSTWNIWFYRLFQLFLWIRSSKWLWKTFNSKQLNYNVPRFLIEFQCELFSSWHIVVIKGHPFVVPNLIIFYLLHWIECSLNNPIWYCLLIERTWDPELHATLASTTLCIVYWIICVKLTFPWSFVREMCIIWVVTLNNHLYLSGVWLGVNLRTDIKSTCIKKRLDDDLKVCHFLDVKVI